MSVKYFNLKNGTTAKYDYDALDNKPDLFNETSLSLPATLAEERFARVSVGSGETAYYGTHNVAALLNMKQGTFSVNGLTITVSGNTVTITGTTNASTYYDFATGENGTGSTIAAHDLGLPAQKYTLSQVLTSGTNVPAICIRSKSSGNVVVAQNSTSVFTMDASTCGGLYFYLGSGKTTNWTFVVGLLPYETNGNDPYRSETSVVNTISQTGLYSISGYVWSSDISSVTILESKLDALKKSCKMKYEARTVPNNSANEVIDIYIPAAVGYVYIQLVHSIKATENANNWRIAQFFSVDSELSQRFKITTLGETEMALKINGRSDFIGGNTHGDEILDSFTVIIDGEKVDITDYTDLTDFDRLTIFETTTLYDPNDSATIVGTHGREYVFSKEGLELSQTVNWSGAYTMDASYMPMICTIRGNDDASELQVTDTYADNGNFNTYDVATSGFTTYPHDNKTDVDRIMLFSDKSGLLITFEILEQTSLLGQNNYLFNGAAYNKIYNAICGNGTQHTTTNGEKWKSRAKLKFEIGEGTDV